MLLSVDGCDHFALCICTPEAPLDFFRVFILPTHEHVWAQHVFLSSTGILNEMYTCMQEFWPLEFKRESMVVVFEVINSAIPSHSGTSFALWAISDECEDAFTG
jgi:hypothetical protein